MITPADHDNTMDERNNNNFLNSSNEQQNNSGLTKAELRKSNKPIMEKKRRARINHCLNELKTLILDAMKKDFKAGFSDCTDETSRYISRMDGVDSGVKSRLLSHLNNCVGAQQPPQITPYTHLTAANSFRSSANILGNSATGTIASILPNSVSMPLSQDVNNNGRIQVRGMQLIPSRLPTGEFFQCDL